MEAEGMIGYDRSLQGVCLVMIAETLTRLGRSTSTQR